MRDVYRESLAEWNDQFTNVFVHISTDVDLYCLQNLVYLGLTCLGLLKLISKAAFDFLFNMTIQLF